MERAKMPQYSDRSKKYLGQCDLRLQKVFNEVIKHWDCSIIEGHRDEETQNQYYYGTPKLSYKKWPDGKHNTIPSRAVHAAPYPLPAWKDVDLFRYFGFYVKGVADAMGIQITWGGDWDRDYDTRDQKFHDLMHFETVDEND
jgi:peptidoglycan L-alanyl-D-glutamate endopeptidase CwlK